ncbi:MAG: hypothetical protein R3C10_14130 [Pirellulales bacterium]
MSRQGASFSKFAKRTRLPLATISAFITIVGLPLTVYFGVFYIRPSEVTIEVLTQTPVLDVREDAEQFEITYRNHKLDPLQRELALLIVRISNTGRTTILESNFDTDDPFGYRVANSAIAVPPLAIAASNDRLKNLALQLDLGIYPDDGESLSPNSKSDVVIPPFIFEPGEYFEHKMLIVHDRNVHPQIEPLGKIAGIRELLVREANDDSQSSFSWNAIADASASTHILRILFYACVVLMTAFAANLFYVAFLVCRGIVLISRRDWLRRRLTKEFKRKHDSSSFDELIYNEFNEGGSGRIRAVLQFIGTRYLWDAEQNSTSDWVSDLVASKGLWDFG